MHKLAKEWDLKHPKELPIDRPCDWCGETVKSGYIHLKCIEEEAKFWYEVCFD